MDYVLQDSKIKKQIQQVSKVFQDVYIPLEKENIEV
jgi:hypothetical protein